MGQVDSGIRSILSRPIVYGAFQRLMGASKARRELVDLHIRPWPGCRVLDLGCGTADILEFLPPDVDYCGYDVSADYIAAAQRRFGRRGRFHCSELTRATLGAVPASDIVLMSGVLHHLDEAAAVQAIELARSALSTGGRLVTIDPCFAEPQSAVARCLIRMDRGRNVRDPDGYRALAAGSFSTVSGTLAHRHWIPYTHWIMECHA